MEQEPKYPWQEIFSRFVEGKCSPAEMQALLSHFGTGDTAELSNLIRQALESDPPEEESTTPERQTVLNRVQHRLTATLFPTKSTPRYKWYYTAAAILLVALATTLYFYRSAAIVNRKSTIVNQIAPGYNQATLTLANGTTVKLDSAQSGIIVNDEDIKYQNGNNVLAEKGKGPGASGESIVTRKSKIVNNILSTPKGGQYQIILPDGTKVWLNSQSSITYPTRFNGDTRTVEISGEAFFDVAQVKDKPFTVKSNGQETIVLGTAFNINSYEPVVKTTLVSGSIQVRGSNAVILSPGEQSINKENTLTKAKADIEQTVSWHNGYFRFHDTPIREVMKQLERWYDIQVSYEGPAPDDGMNGTIRRDRPISEVLQLLEQTKVVHFQVKERRVIVKR
ncbi:FecR family protein [bacterium A37T11]|nr:FecR family protein [bacterium A37T11]